MFLMSVSEKTRKGCGICSRLKEARETQQLNAILNLRLDPLERKKYYKRTSLDY